MGRTPKYQQIADWISRQIDLGKFKIGDKLETEAQLSARFGSSRQTVRQALAELESGGVITRIQGSGSYVRRAYAEPKTSPLSKSVTIISSYTDSYIFPRILKAMAQTLQDAGYSTRIMFTNNHMQAEKKILTQMLESGSRDPVIAEPVTSALPNPNVNLYEELRAGGIPVLFFNTFYPLHDIPHVSMNDIAAGKIVTDYLISLGHTKIGCVLKNDDGQGIMRYRGYMEALGAAGMELKEERVCWVDTAELADSLKGDGRILSRLKTCTAVVCYNDEVAYMLTELCRERGIRIPEDLSLVSIDNSRLTELNPIPLTSAAHPMERLGEKAAENLLRLVENPRFEATYEFTPKLTVRKSAARI